MEHQHILRQHGSTDYAILVRHFLCLSRNNRNVPNGTTPSRGHLLGSDPPGPTRETISGGATPRTRLALVTSSHEPSTTHLSTTKATTSHTLVTAYPNHDEHELHRPSNNEHTKKEQSEFLEKTLWRKIGREDQLIWNEHDHTMALGVAGGVSKLLLLSQSKDYTIERNISVD